ncbi:MAG TPA: YceI family protein [Sunxiuqinia sp.]|nr:YceI family protein [Sunxiuqinia sp.]
MKKNLLLILAIVLSTGAFAQKIYFTKTGKIIFDSTTPMENVHAENEQVTSFIKTTDGEINFAALIKSFKFRNALMEEHFNEDYIHSDQYPKAVFKGKILDFSKVDLSKNEPQKVTVEGNLTLHGVTKKVSTTATIHPENDKILAKADFEVTPAEFGIKIPSIVREKIAKTINISADVTYQPYKK